MSLPLAALIVLLLLAVGLFLRRRQAAQNAESQAKPTVNAEDNTYHAVSIKFSSSACKAAREMEGRRFLSSAAPRLPLPECDVLECKCRFVHHKDRRTGTERRSPFPPVGFGGTLENTQSEQREGADRRHQSEDDKFV